MTEQTAAIPRRILGRTGLDVPTFALGGAGIGRSNVSDDEAVRTVNLARENGIDFFDTSPLYGESERRFGIALQGVPRREYVLSTKTGTHPARSQEYSRDATLWSVENSLRLLGCDYFDIVHIHDPKDDDAIETIFASGGTLDTLEELREQRVLRHIGLGQRKHALHRRAIESGRFDVILTFNDYHPVRTTARENGLLEAAHAANVGVLNGSPMALGLLTGIDPTTLPERLHRLAGEHGFAAAQRLYRFCAEKPVPMAAVVLQFCLRQPLIHSTLTGVSTAAELQTNLDAIRFPLPESIWDDLAQLELTKGQK
jgi:aryl-alcohol dehydrogenase-like predicted oxidoreductase